MKGGETEKEVRADMGAGRWGREKRERCRAQWPHIHETNLTLKDWWQEGKLGSVCPYIHVFKQVRGKRNEQS